MTKLLLHYDMLIPSHSRHVTTSPPGTGTAEPVPKKTTRSMRAMLRLCDFPAAAPDTTTCQTPITCKEMASIHLDAPWSTKSVWNRTILQLQVALEPRIRQSIVVSLSRRLNYLRCELPVVNNDWKAPRDVVDLILGGNTSLPTKFDKKRFKFQSISVQSESSCNDCNVYIYIASQPTFHQRLTGSNTGSFWAGSTTTPHYPFCPSTLPPCV